MRRSSRPLAQVGRFQIVEHVGQGGMGDVFLAREIVAGAASRLAVVKVMRPHLEGKVGFASMFVEEGETALRLSHPHIAHVYDFGRHDGRIYLAMERIHGVSLRDLVARYDALGRPMPIPLALRIAADVAGALDYAHRLAHPVVHRDVSPSNVMVSYAGAVKLLDFGVATLLGTEVDPDAEGIRGKLGYLSPEQCLGWTVDGRSDLFSLGICLFEALTGDRLYRRGSYDEAFLAVCDEPVPPLRSLRPDASPALEALVSRVLAKQIEARFQTGAELQAALERCLFELAEPMGTCRVREAMEALYPDADGDGWDADSGVLLRASLLAPPPPPPSGEDPGGGVDDETLAGL